MKLVKIVTVIILYTGKHKVKMLSITKRNIVFLFTGNVKIEG